MKCAECYYCKDSYCMKWKSVVLKESEVKDCKAYSEAKPNNKGLEVRSKKLNKQRQKRNTVTEGQKGICQFVQVSWEEIKKVNGKYKATGKKHGQGLQVENKVFLIDGHYKYVNNKNLKIEKVFKDVPSWATDEIIKKYQNY